MASVYLAPSCQMANIGKVPGYVEAVYCNKIADEAEPILKRHGVTVYRCGMTWKLDKVVKDSNAKRPDIHLGIHTNGSSNGKATGSVTFCHKYGGNGEKLAKLVQEEIEKISPFKGRGVKEGYRAYLKKGKYYPMYELAYTNAPAALVEVGFHDNQEECTWIVNNIKEIGKALAKAVLKYFGIAYKEEQEKTEIFVYGSKEEQFGPYLLEQYAQNKCNMLKQAGYKDIYYVKSDGTKVPIK